MTDQLMKGLGLKRAAVDETPHVSADAIAGYVPSPRPF